MPATQDESFQFRASCLNFQKLQNVEIIFVDQAEAPSRAQRLNIGFHRSQGSMILFYHPRSLVDQAGLEYLQKQSDKKFWGAFTHSFDVEHALLKFTSWYSNRVRARFSGIIYLDHCIFFHRSFFKDLPPVDIFEDTLLSQQLLRFQRPVLLPFNSLTSAVRFQVNGIYRQAAYNQLVKIGFHLGLAPEKLNQFYERGLGLNSTYKKK